MHIPGGVYFGYRELVLGGSAAIYSYAALSPDWIANLYPWDIDSLAHPAFQYRVYSGIAGDDWPANWTMFEYETRMLKIDVTDNWLDFSFTHQGQFAGDIRKTVKNEYTLEAVAGFTVKNRTAGCPGKYQIMAMR